MSKLFREVLDRAGYTFFDATEENVIKCFLDYADTGAFGDLDCDIALDEIRDGDMTIDDVCQNLLIICK